MREVRGGVRKSTADDILLQQRGESIGKYLAAVLFANLLLLFVLWKVEGFI
jgi:hypothetical protein